MGQKDTRFLGGENDYMTLPIVLKKEKGFTLIELLVVITVIAILAGGAYVALDPATRFADSRDSTRWTDVSAILNAAKVSQVDSGGSYITAISGLTAGTDYMIGTDSGAACDVVTPCDTTITAGNCVDLSQLVTDGYLAAVPVSPNGTGTWTGAETGYYLNRSATGAITIGACESENTSAINVAR